MNLQTLFSKSPFIPQPARFGVVAITPKDAVIVCQNELARDVMGQTYKTTRSMVDTPAVRRALLHTSGQPIYNYCGATFSPVVLSELQ